MILDKPTWNGVGFIKVYLNPVTRLHIWSPKFPPTVHNSCIHDHKFVYTSKVLIGEMEHTEWLYRYNENGSHKLSECYCHTDERERPVQSLQSRGNIEVWRKDIYKAGDSYKFGGPGRYHEIHCSELTVTVASRIEETRDHRPRILTPWGEEPDHAFDPKHTPPVTELRKEVARVMRMLAK